MKRLITLTAAAAAVLLLISLTHHGRRANSPTVASNPKATSAATDVARDYLTALLSGDLATAEARSTALLATQLGAHPPRPGTVDAPARIDLLTLDEQPGFTDLAAELHWTDGRIAALRIQLALLDGRWLVTGVQP